MKKPMGETEIAELQEWLDDKLAEDIEVMAEFKHAWSKRLMYERDNKRFCVTDGMGWVGCIYYDNLEEAVRAFEAHTPRPQPKLVL